MGIRVENLEEKIHDVLGSLNTYAEEVRAENDGWYSLRIQPYRTSDERITGAVLVLVDVTESRRAKEAARNAQALAEGTVAAVRQALLVLDGDLRVMMANRAFSRLFRIPHGEVEGHLIYEIGGGQWDNAELRRLLEEIIPENTRFEDFQIVCEFPGIGRRRLVLDACRIEQEGDRPYLILLGLTDLHDP